MGAWNVREFLALSTPPNKVEGVGLVCRAILDDTHHLCHKGACPGIETANSFM